MDQDKDGQSQVAVFNLVKRAEDKIVTYPYGYPDFKNAIESRVDIR